MLEAHVIKFVFLLLEIRKHSGTTDALTCPVITRNTMKTVQWVVLVQKQASYITMWQWLLTIQCNFMRSKIGSVLPSLVLASWFRVCLPAVKYLDVSMKARTGQFGENKGNAVGRPLQTPWNPNSFCKHARFIHLSAVLARNPLHIHGKNRVPRERGKFIVTFRTYQLFTPVLFVGYCMCLLRIYRLYRSPSFTLLMINKETFRGMVGWCDGKYNWHEEKYKKYQVLKLFLIFFCYVKFFGGYVNFAFNNFVIINRRKKEYMFNYFNNFNKKNYYN